MGVDETNKPAKGRPTISEGTIAAICAGFAENKPASQIAMEAGVSLATVYTYRKLKGHTAGHETAADPRP
jgi:hypothetical protein